jgi:outer membrane murein-binding lipoprotein Lpp
MVHRTPTRDKIKQLSARARELDDVLAALSHEYGADTLDLKARLKQLNEDKNRIQAEVLALKPLARLEDLSIFR